MDIWGVSLRSWSSRSSARCASDRASRTSNLPKAFAWDAKAMGNLPKAFAWDARAMGNLPKAFAWDAKAMGNLPKAFAWDAKAMGNLPKAFTSDAKAMGNLPKAFTSDAKACGSHRHDHHHRSLSARIQEELPNMIFERPSDSRCFEDWWRSRLPVLRRFSIT